MKILINTQISSYDSNGNALIESDSSWNLTQGYANTLARVFPGDYDFMFVTPKDRNKSVSNCLWERWEDADLPNDAFQARFDFGLGTRNAVKHYRPDIIFECDPCKVLNWKYFFPGIPVVCYNSWIDSPLYPKTRNCSLVWRQCEGAYFAEATLCNSKEAKWQIHHSFKYTGSRKIGSVYSIPPIIDERIFDHVREFPEFRNGTVKLIYNHRISDFPYYQDAWKATIQMVNQCATIYPELDYILYVTNPSGKSLNLSEIELRKNIQIVGHLDNLDYDEYVNKLHHMDIALTTFQSDNGGCWSMSLAESMLAGCGLVVPNHGGYKEMVGPDFPPDHDLVDLIGEGFVRESNRIARQHYMKKYSSHITINKLNSILKRVHSGEIKCLYPLT